ncbi:hypothetical protein LCGC14_1932970 [marine sediment metagenome]|uniref:Uncharacterized protein n=1 Tax=marine sediment metagenome TaxID=412755 RepID=A0A0F9FMJ2_9ZZZZ
MNVIDVEHKKPYVIESRVLISEKLLPSREFKGEYLETYAITPIILIENIKIRNSEDIRGIETRKEIYNQIFVLARAYLYVDNTKNHISFYFDGFPWSYLLENVNKETIKKIDSIYDEVQGGGCIENNYKQIIDQLSRMIYIFLNNDHSLKLTVRWAAVEALNPQNKI